MSTPTNDPYTSPVIEVNTGNTPLDPTPEYKIEPSDIDFGPKPEEPTKERVSTRAARKGDSGKGSVFGTLGQNKKPRSGIRKLTEADRDKIASLYTAAAAIAMPFRQRFARALALSADKCADAWMDVANENDSIRRMILAAIEGGTWGKLIAAHALIAVALVPESTIAASPFGTVDFDTMAQMFADDEKTADDA